MKQQKPEEIPQMLRRRYGEIAGRNTQAEGSAPSCCGPAAGITGITQIAPEWIGYSPLDLASAPAGSNLGLGCGNPCSFAALQPGEKVLDLGCGAGGDCFLAAEVVGPSGSVIGVDMTPEMVARAEKNRKGHGVANIEFRLAPIEQLPLEPASIDVVLSNCVINLAPDKEQVYREIYRVLQPGGRIAIADIIARKQMPASIRADGFLYSC